MGEVAELAVGFPFKSSGFTTDTADVRLLRGDNVGQGRVRWDGVKRWPAADAGAYDRYALSPGDIILAMDRPWIEAGLKWASLTDADCPSLLVQRVLRLRARENLDQGFLAYVIGSPRFTEHVLAVQTGTAVPHISSGQIAAYRFEAPPLPEQRLMGRVLRLLDDKIELNRRMNETLEAMAQAIFRDWFVDFGPVRRKLAGATDPVEIMGGVPSDAVAAAELASTFPDCLDGEGRPVGWIAQPLDEIANFTKGRSYTSAELRPSEVALVTLKSFARGGGYRTDGLKPYVGQYRPDQVVRDGDIVVSQTDVTQAADIIGRPAIVCDRGGFETLVASLDVVIVRPKNAEHTPPEYLYQMLNQRRFTDHALAHVTGTTVLHLSKTALPSFEAVVPGKPLANAFEKLGAPIRRKIIANESENRSLAATRDYLLPRLMSGAVRVGDVTRERRGLSANSIPASAVVCSEAV